MMKQITARLSIPYDAIIAESIVGTEVGGLPGSTVVALQRLPIEGEPDGTAIVIDVPDDLRATYTYDIGWPVP